MFVVNDSNLFSFNVFQSIVNLALDSNLSNDELFQRIISVLNDSLPINYFLNFPSLRRRLEIFHFYCPYGDSLDFSRYISVSLNVNYRLSTDDYRYYFEIRDSKNGIIFAFHTDYISLETSGIYNFSLYDVQRNIFLNSYNFLSEHFGRSSSLYNADSDGLFSERFLGFEYNFVFNLTPVFFIFGLDSLPVECNSGVGLGCLYYFLENFRMPQVDIVGLNFESYGLYSFVCELENYGTISSDLFSKQFKFCEPDNYLSVTIKGEYHVKVILASDTLNPSDFFFNNKYIPESLYCDYFLDCDDCFKINDLFKLLTSAVNNLSSDIKKRFDDMPDYTNVLTQIAQNLSIMSNDVNTNLDNINTNILGIKDNLQYTNTDDITKGLAQIEYDKDNSVLVQNNLVESAPFNPHLQKNDLFEG